MNNVTKRTQAERDLEECFVFIGEENLDASVRFLVTRFDICNLACIDGFQCFINGFKSAMSLVGATKTINAKANFLKFC